MRIRNEKEFKDLKIKEPLYNKDLNLINQKNYLINSKQIHKKYVFDKENNFNKNSASKNNNNEIKCNLDFIQKIIDTNFSKYSENNKSFDINYITNKFKKILNNPNMNTIYFPWEATYTKKEENKISNPDIPENEEEKKEEKEIILYGLYPYKLKMQNSDNTKTFLSFLFNKFTDLKISTKKIDKQKTLIKMILKLDKIGLASMGDEIEKYEIIACDITKSIIWLGPKTYLIMNNSDENYFTCRFNFITTLKGNIEVNRISVSIFKRDDVKPAFNINHITKPISIFID